MPSLGRGNVTDLPAEIGRGEAGNEERKEREHVARMQLSATVQGIAEG